MQVKRKIILWKELAIRRNEREKRSICFKFFFLSSLSYALLQLENKELEAKYNLSTQILEAEQAAKKHLMNQCSEYDQRIQSLENDVRTMILFFIGAALLRNDELVWHETNSTFRMCCVKKTSRNSNKCC